MHAILSCFIDFDFHDFGFCFLEIRKYSLIQNFFNFEYQMYGKNLQKT